jgi:hypothetical protein
MFNKLNSQTFYVKICISLGGDNMIEQEKFLEWVDNTISTYDDAPIEVKNGYISISISMLKKLNELVNRQQEELDGWRKEFNGI